MLGGLSLGLPDGLLATGAAGLSPMSWVGQAPLAALAGLGLTPGLTTLIVSRVACDR